MKLTDFECDVNRLTEGLLYGLITREQFLDKILSIEIGGEVVENCINSIPGFFHPADCPDCPGKGIVTRPRLLRDLFEGGMRWD